MSKILAISTDWAMVDTFEGVQFRITPKMGGTGSYRLAIPGAELEKHGHTVVQIPMEGLSSSADGLFVGEDFQGNKHFDCDVIWMQRLMGEDMPERIKRARACGQVVVQDLDDNFDALPTSNVAFHMTHVRMNQQFNRSHYRKAIAASSGITCSTPYLAKTLEKLGVPTFICRNAIDIDRWPVLDPTDTGNVGWVGGIPWRGSDLQILKGVLGPFLEKNDLTFIHGGDSPHGASAAFQIGLDPKKITIMTSPIVDFADYPGLWEPIDIALVPIDCTSFGLSKSWIKGLEACASGLPFIASDHPAYRELGAGRLAKDARHWLAHLEALLDPTVRKEEGLKNRERAEELSIGNQWQVWEQAFQAIAGAA